MEQTSTSIIDSESGKPVAVVLGGYVNGFSIIRELHQCGVEDIWLFDYGTSLARHSNRLRGVSAIGRDAESLFRSLEELHKDYGLVVLFPTDDTQIEYLEAIAPRIESYCYIPFNSANVIECLDKNFQYERCEDLGVPYPKGKHLSTVLDLEVVGGMQFPLLIKPTKRRDLTESVFRTLYLESAMDLEHSMADLNGYLERGFEFVCSEFVPGDDTHIYAYTAYRSKAGRIFNEWIGKKLNQYPDEFGVFSSASNEAPEVVREQGRKLLEGMGIQGIAEPEFKYDSRDGKYKLMEINLRSMMWHRVGALSGVDLHHAQWLDAQGLAVPEQTQEVDSRVHFVYMKYEIVNLLRRKKYWKRFRRNVLSGNKRHFAVFDSRDLKPFFRDFLSLIKLLLWRKKS